MKTITKEQFLELVMEHNNVRNVELLGVGGCISSINVQPNGQLEIVLQQVLWREATVAVQII
jgi:hypothetical protein